MFSPVNSIIIWIGGRRTAANNEEIMIKSLPESIKTSKPLSEMDVSIFANVNFDTHPLHQSIPEERKQCAYLRICVYL